MRSGSPIAASGRSCGVPRRWPKNRGVKVATHILTGHPVRDIIMLAGDLEADLLVIGATGHSTFYERVLGTRADRLVRSLPLPHPRGKVTAAIAPDSRIGLTQAEDRLGFGNTLSMDRCRQRTSAAWRAFGAPASSPRMFGETFPWGTLLVNVLGSFVIGLHRGADRRRTAESSSARPLALPSWPVFCGGYTTFSSFSLQTLSLLNDGEWRYAGGEYRWFGRALPGGRLGRLRAWVTPSTP